MPGKFDLYAFGEAGVNVVDSVVHVATNQLRRAQNAQWTPQEEQKGLCLRPGMQPLNAVAMGGAILALMRVPFPSPFQPGPEPVRVAVLARDIFTGTSRWLSSADGVTFGSQAVATGSFSVAASLGGAPVSSGQTVYSRNDGATYSLRLYDGVTVTTVLADVATSCGFIPVNVLPILGGTACLVQGNPTTTTLPMLARVELPGGAVTTFGGARGTRTVGESRATLIGDTVWMWDETNNALVSVEIGDSALTVRASLVPVGLLSHLSPLGQTVGLSTSDGTSNPGRLYRFDGASLNQVLAVSANVSNAVRAVVAYSAAQWSACTTEGVYTTFDAGFTWTLSNLTASVVDGVRFASSTLVKRAQALYQSTDGLTWTSVVTLIGNEEFAARWGGQP